MNEYTKQPTTSERSVQPTNNYFEYYRTEMNYGLKVGFMDEREDVTLKILLEIDLDPGMDDRFTSKIRSMFDEFKDLLKQTL